MISHLKNTRYLHGGHVYRESIKKMLTANDPGLIMDEIFVHDQQHRYWRLCRQIYDVLTSPFSKYPAKVNHFRTRAFRKRLTSILAKTHYTFFVISGGDMLWCLECIPPTATILYISHNIEHLLYNQQVAKYASVPWLGRLLLADAEKFKTFEIEHIKQLQHIVTITDQDQSILQGYCSAARIATIMPSFDYVPHKKNPRPKKERLRLGFLGNLEWWPNRRSLQWFLDEIFPHLGQTIELHLYGQGSTAFSDGGKIHGHGFVPDLSEIWNGIDLMIQPITCGAGINIKVAEALYNRMPMVATPLALRGIPLVEDKAVVIMADARDWITYLNEPTPANQALSRVRQTNADLFSMQKNRLALQALFEANAPVPGPRFA
ncbi:MAG: glycosyltransferase family 4 protein [Desulfobulbaceae bacterium]|nr:glycosyltransferase family 4 protein [Desulfobulbaceae bacterium]